MVTIAGSISGGSVWKMSGYMMMMMMCVCVAVTFGTVAAAYILEQEYRVKTLAGGHAFASILYHFTIHQIFLVSCCSSYNSQAED